MSKTWKKLVENKKNHSRIIRMALLFIVKSKSMAMVDI